MNYAQRQKETLYYKKNMAAQLEAALRARLQAVHYEGQARLWETLLKKFEKGTPNESL